MRGVRGGLCCASPHSAAAGCLAGIATGKKVEIKCFCLPDLVSFKEERRELAGCVWYESRVFPFVPLELLVPGSPMPPVRAVGSSVSAFIGMEL